MVIGSLEYVPDADRECPFCGQETLVEKSLTIWKCINPTCGKEVEDEWLDDGEDLEENY